jgi:hypothetical protein
VVECILNVLYRNFPFVPIMDAGTASMVARDIREAMENGQCKWFFECYAEECAETGSASEKEGLIEWGLDLMNEHVTFLEGRGAKFLQRVKTRKHS